MDLFLFLLLYMYESAVFSAKYFLLSEGLLPFRIDLTKSYQADQIIYSKNIIVLFKDTPVARGVRGVRTNPPLKTN